MAVTYSDYGTGHPSYYKLDSRVLTPKEILTKVKAADYRGYMKDDITKADNRPEPQRSEALRKIKANVLCELWCDISSYRHYAYRLHLYRQTNDPQYAGGICDGIQTNISLKHNHIYNDMGHLVLLEELLTRQMDLFTS